MYPRDETRSDATGQGIGCHRLAVQWFAINKRLHCKATTVFFVFYTKYRASTTTPVVLFLEHECEKRRINLRVMIPLVCSLSIRLDTLIVLFTRGFVVMRIMASTPIRR